MTLLLLILHPRTIQFAITVTGISLGGGRHIGCVIILAARRSQQQKTQNEDPANP